MKVIQILAHVAFRVMGTRIARMPRMGTDSIIHENPCHQRSIYAKFEKYKRFINSLNPDFQDFIGYEETTEHTKDTEKH